MKRLIVSLAFFVALILGGWSAVGDTAGQGTELRTPPERVARLEEIAGTWHAFPAGLILQFNDDGSAKFGTDLDGTILGYEAEIGFEGRQFSIRFSNYDGRDEVCASATGVYTVQRRADGIISFAPVHDDCHFRMESLSGPKDAAYGLMYHPVKG